MASFLYRASDGNTYQIETPEGGSRDEGIARLEADIGNQEPDYLQEVVEEVGPVEAGAIAAGRTLHRLGTGVRDLYAMTTGDEETRQEIASEEAERERLYEPLAEARPVATTVGGAVPYFAVPGVQGTLPMRIAGEAVLGGALGGLTYGEGVEGAAAGAAGGAFGGLTGALLRRIQGPEEAPRISPERMEMLQQAEDVGYRTLPSERIGSSLLGDIEAGMSRTALLSGPFKRLHERNQDLVNKLAREAIGEERLEGQLTDSVLENATKRIGRGFEDLAPDNFRLDVSKDDDFYTDLVRIDREFLRDPMRTNRWPKFRDQTLEVLQEKPLSLREYLRVVESIARKARQVGRGENADPSLERTLYGLREAIDGAFERALIAADPDAESMLREVRRQYRTLKLLEKPGVIKAGDVRVLPLRNVLKREGKGIVRSSAPMSQIARIGEYLASKVGTSGTAEGMAVQSMIADPIESTVVGLLGNVATRGYLAGATPLARGADVGQAMAGAIDRGIGVGDIRYLSPAQIVRSATLANLQNQ